MPREQQGCLHADKVNNKSKTINKKLCKTFEIITRKKI